MESMTVAEAIELIRMNEAAMATQFQAWISITFATIVAVFVARNVLNKIMKWLITALYLLSCVASSAMWQHYFESNLRLTEVLIANGVEQNESALVVAGASAMTMYFLGIATTLYFIHMSPIDRGST